MADPTVTDPLDFLAGGGEMGARIRAFDWASTPLGTPPQWTQPLRTLVGVMLGAGQPMFVAWGRERTMFYNDGYAPLCGDKHPRALGRPFDEVWADILDAVGPIMDRAYAGMPTYMDDIQFAMLDRHGYEEETHFAFSYTPVRDEGGRVVGIFCACNETTERVFAERRLRFLFELNDRLRHVSDPRAIMAAAAEAIGRHLGAGRVGYAETEEDGQQVVIARDWTDGTMSSLAGSPVVSVFGGDVLHALRAGEIVRVEDVDVDPRTAHASIRAGAGITVPLVKDGRLVAAVFVHAAGRRRWRDDEVGVVRDVAERMWDALGRARSDQRLRDEHRRKDEFLATLAHELRNPLAPLRTGVRVLQEGDSKPEVLATVRDMMERQLAHMVRLIDDLLDVSRVSRGLVELRIERVDLRDVVALAVETSLPLIEAGGHELTVALPPEALPLDADPTRLAQVLGNLLNNAAKYTPPGGRVVIDAALEHGKVAVNVRDNGIGISADLLPRVFDMFTQARPDTDRPQGGLGIGLTLARRLTEMHGGSVSVASSDAGSTFTVRLPAGARAEGSGPESPPPVSVDAVAPATPLRVLVVDDNTDSVAMLTLLLELLGHQVASANSGAEALAVSHAFGPDVVLLDIGLPGMDGYEVAREIRRRAAGRPLLLAAITGWGSDGDKVRARDHGFDHHLTKPVPPDVIASLLASVTPRNVDAD